MIMNKWYKLLGWVFGPSCCSTCGYLTGAIRNRVYLQEKQGYYLCGCEGLVNFRCKDD